MSKRDPKEHVAVRLNAQEIARIEALRSRLSEPWRQATRSDVLRAAILKGLEALEEERTPPTQAQEEPVSSSQLRRAR
ncbi:MAG: hypothetical protein QM820_29710 [Minicystis sp.]